MNWKYTAVVSGAGLLATWFAAAPPVPKPALDVPPQAQASATSGTMSDIEQEAARLQVRTPPANTYHEPERNLFRFGSGEGPARAATSAPAPIVQPEALPPPPPPPIKLSGIAADQVGDRSERTAILSTPSGVVLAREGDDVLGQYRVSRIAEDAVELENLSDHSTLRLALR